MIEFIRGKVGKAVVVWGQSLGASIAIQTAASAPELVRALIVEEPTMDFAEIEESRVVYSLLRDLAASGKRAAEIKTILAQAPIPIPGKDKPAPALAVLGEATITSLARSTAAVDPGTWDALLDGSAYANHRVEEIFPAVSCPVLFFQGNPERRGMAHATAAYGVALIPGCSHVYLENGGHNLHRTQPEEEVREAKAFLSAHRQD